MANYTVTTTARQEAVLTFLLTEIINPRRAAQNPSLPPVNKTQLINFQFDERLADLEREVIGFENKDRSDKFVAASQVTKDQIDTLLGTKKA